MRKQDQRRKPKTAKKRTVRKGVSPARLAANLEALQKQMGGNTPLSEMSPEEIMRNSIELAKQQHEAGEKSTFDFAELKHTLTTTVQQVSNHHALGAIIAKCIEDGVYNEEQLVTVQTAVDGLDKTVTEFLESAALLTQLMEDNLTLTPEQQRELLTEEKHAELVGQLFESILQLINVEFPAILKVATFNEDAVNAKADAELLKFQEAGNNPAEFKVRLHLARVEEIGTRYATKVTPEEETNV